ncbi:non-homologous end-joining DNA ligase [Cryptosporangium phraense]|uniref:DNA polymerase domain-containing protein n=1 Tax=Cryptosporangium phraense TaxID=2593070 RepID=A0A545ATF6_9ACTN|nr:non-homologous end-joining DNA ligase [Cryptosporangium phraense]TQS44616.1 DNA polymerase domain-containing protein [Cryptosporangium phraense]
MASRATSPAVEVPVGDRVVRISNPDRVYFDDPHVTKLDIVKYYLSVGEGIVRALRERPCMLHRYPDGVYSAEGVEGEKIYQKRLPRGAPEWVESVQVKFPSGRSADELCVTELASVAWAVQMSTVEFHPWHSRRANTEQPDELRIDLDPQPGTGLAEARTVGGVVHEMLDELGWAGWPKTSGNRGIHIYVRIRPDWTFTEVRRAALAFAREVERRVPQLATTAWWKEERGEKIFVDFNQNARDRTIASAYSLRGRSGALVSAPITWDELVDVESEDFTIRTVPPRFAELGDLHAGIDDVAVGIEPLLEWSERDARDLDLGDAPYPPNYPKMEGEPMRVQPSRARKPG